MEETWRDIGGFEGSYQVSNLGRVRSLDRNVRYSDGRIYRYKGKLISPTKDTNGYLQVGLKAKGTQNTKRIHRLVAENFFPCDDGDKEVNHIDGDKENNKTENLEWVTSAENTQKGYEIGLFDKTRESAKKRWLKNTFQAKPVRVYFKNGNYSLNFRSAREASNHISKCQNYFTELLRKGGENKYYKVEQLSVMKLSETA